MSLKQAREASGLKAREVVGVLQQHGSRVDVPLYSHCEQERVDLNAQDREIAAELLHVPCEAVATALKPREASAEGKRPRRAGNPELRHRVTPRELRQIDEDVQACGYTDRRAWLTACIHRLRVEARKAAGRVGR